MTIKMLEEILEDVELTEPELDDSPEVALHKKMIECAGLFCVYLTQRSSIEHGLSDERVLERCNKVYSSPDVESFLDFLRLYLIMETEKMNSILAKYHEDYINGTLKERTLGEIYERNA